MGVRDTQRDFSFFTEVKGLKELQRELRQANPEMAKRLQVVNKRLVETVAAKARAAFYTSVDQVSAPVRDGPVRTGRRSRVGLSRVRDSIKASASGREARIRAGGARVPTFFGFEFGGSRGLEGGPGYRVLGIGFGRRKETREIGRRAAAGGRFRRRLVRVRTRQFPVHKGREGYVLYPAVRRERKHAFEDWSKLFDEVMGVREGP